jgi:3-hydroxyisobutyrate dehydrogenase-like beta-hydroxyacid dehydrogenase
MDIACLGLGRMGAAMAGRLAGDRARALTVWNRSVDKARPFAERGARIADDPAAAVAGADLVISSLMDDRSVEALFHADGPALKAMKPGAIHLCVTTISPDCGNRLQALHGANGSRYVSGPVVGRPDAAASGTLTQFVAGDASAVSEVAPVARAFAERVVPLGDIAGVANAQKLCVNFFLAATIEAMSECFTFGEAAGARRDIIGMFFEQVFAAPGLKGYAERLARRETSGDSGFAMTAGFKDVNLIRDAARAAHCPVEIADAVASKMEEAIALGMGSLDWSATQEITRRRAGLAASTGG